MTLVERQNVVIFSFLNFFFFNVRDILAQYFLFKNLLNGLLRPFKKSIFVIGRHYCVS